jgi:hypothetical protein
MTGNQLITLGTSVNGGATIEQTLFLQFLNLAKAMVEQLRPWMILRRTDTSKTVTASSTSAWQTAIDLSTIANFSRFYETDTQAPIKLFDGTYRIEQYRQVPWNERVYYKDIPNTFVYDEANKLLYLNGVINFSGTLYIDHIVDSADITAADTTAWGFPSWSHLLLAFFAVGLYKGGVDFDDVNARMAPDNRAQAAQILGMLERWDTEKQHAALTRIDPYRSPTDGYRSGAINMD